MDSSSSRTHAKLLEQAEIKRKIAELQRQLEPEAVEAAPPLEIRSPKRRAPNAVTLAPATPSPKKKRKVDHRPQTDKPLARPVFHTAPQQNAAAPKQPEKEKVAKVVAPSSVISKLATLGRASDPDEGDRPSVRTTGFTEQAAAPQAAPAERLTHKRDERLALIENLQPGPYEHSPPHDDPAFEKLEPHSGINLTSRVIKHDEFNDFFTGRYYLSPSRLYSAIRLLPDKQGYDVPVPGDWITIAVVAERGPIKFTRAPVKIERESGEQAETTRKPWKGKGKAEPEERGGKKFVNIRLIDFGARVGGSASGGKAVIRGDAALSLLLFEADSIEYIDTDDGRKPQKIYRGGSRGAFENLTNIREGDVIAMLNPKILKPFQRSADTPHPVDNVLAVTPEAAASIIVVGRARDLGMCQVLKQNGKVCGSWCDKRVSDVCDYHVQSAVQRRRAARPEFSVGTGGMSSAPTFKRKHDYDPRTKWGLKPEARAAGADATYMIAGHIVSGSASDARTLYAAESIGRDGQAKARRKLAGAEGDAALKRLLERDKDGMKVVMLARQAGKEDVSSRRAKDAKGKERGTGKSTGKNAPSAKPQSADGAPKTVYSASVIKGLGFDPALKAGQKRVENEGMKNKLEELEAVRIARKDPALGPRPGPRIRSGVRAPVRKAESNTLPAPPVPDRNDMEDIYASADSGDDQFPMVLSRSTVPAVVNLDDTEKADTDKGMVDLDDF
ncbi:hypothetical protein HYPSUDRAFT_161464 [Hypholoma sublateritium FD-334 SS-4]|uniref:Zinc finger Mcm10/DnaG-type domain-containing protein n=1 Tax=Hypholoma sublateritium (strain FD-334 SS-4) TaxID=945553 RepID=A0A0D2MLX5_HYPSF|nr:hypothetical protein HYPSUDRAFT_161464 [Hypholoma sublateritium FD-334 SS-4]